MPNQITNKNKSAIKIILLSIYIDIIKNINSLLLVFAIILNQIIIYNFINRDNLININKEKYYL